MFLRLGGALKIFYQGLFLGNQWYKIPYHFQVQIKLNNHSPFFIIKDLHTQHSDINVYCVQAVTSPSSHFHRTRSNITSNASLSQVQHERYPRNRNDYCRLFDRYLLYNAHSKGLTSSKFNTIAHIRYKSNAFVRILIRLCFVNLHNNHFLLYQLKDNHYYSNIQFFFLI